jgi:hypothetical protein
MRRRVNPFARSAPYRVPSRVSLGALGAAALSPDAIQAFAANAGFSGADLATAVAIAFAESSGIPTARNPEGSYGLWQIYLPAHPEFAGQNLYDPQTNANAAFSIYSRAGGFSDWTTFRSGRYRVFLAPSYPPGSPSPAPPPLTIDAATGQPVYDATDTASLLPAVPTPAWAKIALLTASFYLLYGLADSLSD